MLSACTANDWDCLCTQSTNVLTCYNNCPSDPNAFGAQQTQTSYCNAAKAYGSSASSSLTATASVSSGLSSALASQSSAISAATASAASATGSSASSASSGAASATGSATGAAASATASSEAPADQWKKWGILAATLGGILLI